MIHEAYGYEPPRYISFPCGWGQRFPNLRAANNGAAQHMAECSQGCTAYHVEDLR